MERSVENKLTPLESSIVALYYAKFAHAGFPNLDEICVVRRENTGSGRYTYVSHSSEINLPDGKLDVGIFGQLNMSNLKCGASFWMYLRELKLSHIEIAVNGNEYWDGAEGDWEICDPDTGEF